jgi:hypothetical protein
VGSCHHVRLSCIDGRLPDVVSISVNYAFHKQLTSLNSFRGKGLTPEATFLRTEPIPLTLSYARGSSIVDAMTAYAADLLPASACHVPGCRFNGIPGLAKGPDPFGTYLMCCDTCSKQRKRMVGVYHDFAKTLECRSAGRVVSVRVAKCESCS